MFAQDPVADRTMRPHSSRWDELLGKDDAANGCCQRNQRLGADQRAGLEIYFRLIVQAELARSSAPPQTAFDGEPLIIRVFMSRAKNW